MKKLATLAAMLSVTACHDGAMKTMLDDMAVYFEVNNGKFDQVYYDKLQNCLASDNDAILPQSQESAWQAMQDYYSTNGTSQDSYKQSDHWGDCTLADQAEKRCTTPAYMRREPAIFPGTEGKTILIEEPCNYVSNIAFYHAVTRICDYPDWTISKKQIQSQKRSFATLGMGSAFWHGSHTYAGMVFDNNMIAVISYLAMESITQYMPGDSYILKHLSETPRNQTSYEVVEGLTKMFSEQDPSEWSMTLNDIDMPTDYIMIFAAFLATIGALLAPWFLVHFIFSKLGQIAIKDKENQDFFVNKFLPELQLSSEQISLDTKDQASILHGFEGMLIKIIYAFLWQEHYIPDHLITAHLWEINVGAHLLPVVNLFSSLLSGFPQTDSSINWTTNVYPGDKYCNAYSPHAMWHEESANGLLEIVFLSNTINQILSNQRNQ